MDNMVKTWIWLEDQVGYKPSQHVGPMWAFDGL